MSIKFPNFANVIINSLTLHERFRLGSNIERKLSERDVFAPLAHLTNCSGTGKTRAALELGKLTNVLYFKLGTSNGLDASRFGHELVKYFHKRRVAMLVILAAWFPTKSYIN